MNSSDATLDRSPDASSTGAVVSARINGERLSILGWGRAVLLQFAHPLVATGIAEHSSFDEGPAALLARTRGTIEAMLAFTFGPEERARAAAARINAIHDRVHGRLAEPAGVFPAGHPYSARDPKLLAWVHATLLDSMLLAFETFVEPLAADDKDRYCAEATVMGPRLGIPAELLPTTHRDLAVYLRNTYASGAIAVTPTARRLAERLLSPPLGPLAYPVARLLRLTAVGLLPPHIRDAYGFEWGPSSERRRRALARMLRSARPLLPRVLLEWREARDASA